MINLKIDIDPERILERQLSELEQKQVPFALSKAINRVAWQVRESWKGEVAGAFKNPRAFTRNSALVLQASKTNLSATIFIRDKAAGGVAPNKYLQAQVFGGQARLKRAEKALGYAGVLNSDQRIAPGKSARLDASGDISGRQMKAIIAGVADKQNGYFAIKAGDISHLKPGVFQRKGRGKKKNIRAVLNFIKAPNFIKRLNIFGIAEKVQARNMPQFFKDELEKAVASTWNKAFKK